MPAAEETNPPVDTSRFRMRFTREEANKLLRYGHPIPVSHGFTDRHVRENYPGWTWSRLAEVLKVSGVFATSPGGGPPTTVEELTQIWFTSTRSWLVEWTDGTFTSSTSRER